jgi:protein-S-isoprenylcysteine O-methyltransferase Ste14
MLGIIYSVVAYLGFLATYVYLAAFSDGILVPRTVDTGTSSDLAVTFALDLGLILVFGLQHSLMARSGFKRALTRVVPEGLERTTYVLASSAALILLMWQWRPLPAVLWRVESPALEASLWAANALGWLGVPACSFMIDHFDLFGIKPAFNRFRRTSFERTGFVTPLVYRYVRHPMMTSLLLGLWVTPHMTLGHLLLSTGMSAYIVIGVQFEERALSRELGLAYAHYQASTPKFFPTGTKELELGAGPKRI